VECRRKNVTTLEVAKRREESRRGERARYGSGRDRGARTFARGSWTSGGLRVVYFFLAGPGRIYMAAIYAKSRKDTLSTADPNVLAKLAAEIKKGGR